MINRVCMHPGIPGIYLILISLLKPSAIVLVFRYTPGKGEIFENS